METMTVEQLKTKIKFFKERARELKILELNWIADFIIQNQSYEGFWANWKPENAGRTGQGEMWIDEEEGWLNVNWDETFPFDDQEELFKELFDGDFDSDKYIRIFGLKL